MSETGIIILVIFITSILFISGIGWYFFVYTPRLVGAVVSETAHTIKDGLGFTPQVTVNDVVFFKQTREILELALLEHTVDVDDEFRHNWLGSEKIINLQGTYKAKIGFDLQKGFQIELRRGKLLKSAKMTVHLPRAEVLSMEDLKIKKFEQSGIINWVGEQDRKIATKRLTELARSKVVASGMLVGAEHQIENRLAEILLPKLNTYSLKHEIKFFEGTIPTQVASINIEDLGITPESLKDNEKETPVIEFYHLEDEYGCFSNFAHYPIRFKDKEWPTSEHYFQAQKYAGTKREEAVRKAKSPRIAAEMGRDRNNPIRQDWEIVKDDIMREAVLAKFTQHAELREILLGTEDALLVEHTANDNYWGDGGNGQGKNMLGKILMEVREKLKKEE